MYKSLLEDTIAAPATPIGEGGIGIVRISGPLALAIADKIFIAKDGGRPSGYETYTVHYGHIVDRGSRMTNNETRNTKHEPRTTNDGIIDEVLLTVMRAPKSYTKEDVIEINCHGGIEAVKNVLGIVMKHGARLAEPGEFTKKAFLNGRIDLAQAEAVLDVIRARTEGSLRAAMDQLNGRLSKDVCGILDELINIASHIEAAIDFPEEQLDIINEEKLAGRMEGLTDRVKQLIDSFNEGVILREGILAVICGKPNVGKSSLMNLLLKRDRVIVAPVPGTTRDAVEEMINIGGLPIRLVDTAGIGVTEDALYKESAKRSRTYIGRADIALLMLDATSQIDDEDLAIIRMVEDKKKVVIINKIDLDRKIDRKSMESLFRKNPVIEISVEDKRNIGHLERKVLDTVWSGKFTQAEAAIVSNARHKELLDKAFNSMLSVRRLMEESSHAELIAVDLKEAIFNLGLIIGKSVSDEVLDRVFENFCIGK